MKESWHNVSEDEVEKFKEEWISKSGSMLKLKQNEELKNDELEEFKSGNAECENEKQN